MKRQNPYNIEDVMQKHGISKDEAIIKIAELKKRTTITLENLIRKHGEEEGRKRFDLFRNRSAHTKEKYMEKYGDNWECIWNEYLGSKSCGLNKFIERYGEEDGGQRYEEYQNKKSFSNSLVGYIEKYGVEEGVEKYETVTKSRDSSTLSHFIEKYGEEDGYEKYKEVNAKKDSSSLQRLCEIHGENEGVLKYENLIVRRSPVFCAIKKEYGEEAAVAIYAGYTKKTFNVISKDYKKISKYKTKPKAIIPTGPVSKESTIFFSFLETVLGRKLKYGSKGEELKLLDKENLCCFYYDCLDEQTNTIIEFHGITWHPKQDQSDWTNPFGLSYSEKMEKDLQKQKIAESNGYVFLIVYSDEVKSLIGRKTKADEIKEVIDANCKKNKETI